MSGWSCPVCGAESRVTETRASARGLRRRRACAAKCGWRVTTLEIVAPTFTTSVRIVRETALLALVKAVAALGPDDGPPPELMVDPLIGAAPVRRSGEP